MADPNTDEAHDREPTTGTTRWQKLVGIIGLVVVLAVVGVMLFGGGPASHGPDGTGDENQEEAGTDGGGDHSPPPWVPEGGH